MIETHVWTIINQIATNASKSYSRVKINLKDCSNMYNCTVCIKGDQEQIKHSKEIDYTAIGFLDEKILNKMVCIICVVHGKGLFLGKDERTLAIYT